jgi:hypothetical protein
VSSPSLTGRARRFSMNCTGAGTGIFHNNFDSDAYSTHFVYEIFLYLDDSAVNMSSLDFVVNQVIPNGDTVVFGLLCDGGSGTWQYSVAADTNTVSYKSNIACTGKLPVAADVVTN